MKIKIIDYGYDSMPIRAHETDAGCDVKIAEDYVLKAHETHKFGLKFGVDLPNGTVGFIFPRSSMAAKGITCELPPIDSGYIGEIHAVVTNNSDTEYIIKKGDRLGQLVVFPCIIFDLVEELKVDRGDKAFGSTGK